MNRSTPGYGVMDEFKHKTAIDERNRKYVMKISTLKSKTKVRRIKCTVIYVLPNDRRENDRITKLHDKND